jgi:hypothetical protein
MKPRSILALVFLSLSAASAAPLDGPFAPDHPLATRMTDAQKRALESIAEQPLALHPAIISVASDVPLLLRIAASWRDFELALEPVVADYDTSERAALQDLLRHPGLLPTLLEVGPEGEAALTRALEAYPDPIREVALAAGLNHRALLTAVEFAREAAVRDFEALIAAYPDGTREAYRAVVGRPQLIAQMIESLETTEMLAGSARVDLAGTLAGLTDLHKRVARSRAEAEAERIRRAEAQRQATQARATEKRAKRERRLDRGYYSGRSGCWAGAGGYYSGRYGAGYTAGRRCWYPWHRYGRRWW